MLKSLRKTVFSTSLLCLPLIVVIPILVYSIMSFQEIRNSGSNTLSPDSQRAIWGTPGIFGTTATVIGGFLVYLNYINGIRNRELSEKKQVAEQFSKAVELLGSSKKEKIQVRIGAIYALLKTGTDFPEYRQLIINVLAAFVREASHLSGESDNAPDEENKKRTPTDIQAALNVISELSKLTSRKRGDIDLSGSFLHYAWLNNQNLERGYFWDVDLKEGYLEGAVLKEANFWRSKLVKADFRRANLYRAKLGEANFESANLEGADLRKANLQDITNFRDAKLKGAKLGGAILLNTDLSGCDSLQPEQIEESAKGAWLCETILPAHLKHIDSNRDCYKEGFKLQLRDRRSSLKNKPLSETEKYIQVQNHPNFGT